MKIGKQTAHMFENLTFSAYMEAKQVELAILNQSQASAKRVAQSMHIIQKNLANKICISKLPSKIRRVAGFDVSYLKKENTLIAGMVVLDYPSLRIQDRFLLTDKIGFPYIPGFLSFREAPLLLNLIEKHHQQADIFIFDGSSPFAPVAIF